MERLKLFSQIVIQILSDEVLGKLLNIHSLVDLTSYQESLKSSPSHYYYLLLSIIISHSVQHEIELPQSFPISIVN